MYTEVRPSRPGGMVPAPIAVSSLVRCRSMMSAYCVLDRTATAVTAGGNSGWFDSTRLDSWAGFLLTNSLETSQIDCGERNVRLQPQRGARPEPPDRVFYPTSALRRQCSM